MLADLKIPGALLRNKRRLETAMRASRLPAVKTVARFDFAFQPSIKLEPATPDDTSLAGTIERVAVEHGRRAKWDRQIWRTRGLESTCSGAF